MRLRPVGKGVVVRPIHKSDGYGDLESIVIPEDCKRHFTGLGEVLAIGPKVDRSDVLPGNTVAFDDWQGRYITTDAGARVCIVKENDVAGTFEGKLPDFVEVRQIAEGMSA